jgi:putative phage-type endonuclease
MTSHSKAPQRSPEWFKARKGRVTGSNWGAVLGVNPYRTPENVLRSMVREYHGAESEFTGNVATEWGTAMEETATFAFEMRENKTVTEVGFYPYKDFAGASPDGEVSQFHLIEIKCPWFIRNDKPPVFKTIAQQPYYHAQMQAEMLCTGKQYCYFYQWTPHGDSLEVVDFDLNWISENLPKIKSFHELYLSELDNPAHLEQKRKAVNTEQAIKLIEEYDQLVEAVSLANERKAQIVVELVETTKGADAVICGRKFTKVVKKGSVSYAKIVKEQLPELDLEQYRSAETKYWRLT